MRHLLYKLISVLSVFAFATMACQSAHAQSNTNGVGGSIAEQILTNNAMEVISVTASKSPQAINNTPDSVSAILASQIETISPQHINQVLDAIPGTWISRGNGQEHLTAIRSPVLTGAGSCGAFFMGLDGISIRAPGFCNSNQLFDINYEQARSIDVLRSPASTLYGGNALHGVINFITADAFNVNNNQASLQVGAEDFARLSSSYGKTYQDSAWLNLTNVTQENGFQAQSGYDQQKMTHIYQTDKKEWSNKTVLDISNLNQETAGFIRGFESFKDSEIRKTNPNPEAYRDVKSLRLYSKFNYFFEQSELQITPYLRANSMAFLQHFLPWQALEKNSHTSIGVQNKYQYLWQNINWILGADIDYTKGSLTETQDDDFSPSIPKGIHYDYDVNATQLATYLQGLWRQNNLSIRFGARLERNAYDYNNNTEGRSACADDVAVCRFSRPDNQSVSFTALSPSINIQYQIKSNLSVYGKFSQGFRAPQATELFRLQNNQQVADIENENMLSFEIGSRFYNEQTLVHFAIYTMNKKDVIFQNSERQNVSNGETKHQGVEFELTRKLTDSLSLQGHVSYAEHTYSKDTSLVSTNIKGNEIDTAPKWFANASINYQPLENLNAQLTWQHLSSYYLNPENTAKYDGHDLLDINLSYQLANNTEVSLHMLNLTNVAYAERADFAFGNYRYFVGQPRRAFIKFIYSY